MMHRLAPVPFLICLAGPALAHASEQGIVLLLPTGLYIAGGVASVVATVLLISALPPGAARALFHPLTLWRGGAPGGAVPASCIAFLGLLALVVTGLTGPHDPSENLLPLSVWSLFWFGLVVAQGIFGDLWHWLNPWTGPAQVARRLLRLRSRAPLPAALGHWPALVTFLGFAAVLLVHPAPADPDTLALMVASYWAFHFAGMLIFGDDWLNRAEGLSALMNTYARIAPFGLASGQGRVGLPGWKVLSDSAPGPGLAVMMIAMLAVGSFDGLNETFWWMGLIGVNPLEFPGRSAVVADNLAGLAIAVPALVGAYAVSVWLGLRLVGPGAGFAPAFRALAPAVLPIAFGYHFGHYMPSFLVEIQYVASVISETLGQGHIRVTTGFFNTFATVRVIWLAQAGAVVSGHVLAILLSHVLALQMFGTHRKAALSQLPLAIFMVAYTLFGLWLLASPRGA